ncbi:hypothetical protein [Micromonospora zhanjiangensis]|uniref:DUF3800 domain-containing protein n=1 Tax=Micromonospora zhanjiangensis TaxID=1522057 RepID=A0ABV8KXH5_9ACTN
MAGQAGRRLPLQGGLPPVAAVTGPVVEIACDESGFSGTNLLDPATPLITHASVDLSTGEAAELIATLRSGYRFSPDEVKSRHFPRRPEAGAALRWFLAALRGRAHVHLVDKQYFLVTRIIDLLLAEPTYAAGTRLAQESRPAAVALYRAGRPAGPDWDGFLAAFVEMTRTKRRDRPDRQSAERFLQARDALVRHGLGARAEAVLRGLDRSRVNAVLDRLGTQDRSIPPPLEPMLPALAETVLFWSDGDRRVLVTHDEQSALTADRLRRLQQALTTGIGSSPTGNAEPSAGASPLAGLVMVDSRDDPRVQVADLLAGLARRLPGTVDDGPLRPLLSTASPLDPAGDIRTAERPRKGSADRAMFTVTH